MIYSGVHILLPSHALSLLQCGYEGAHEVSFLDIQLDIKPFGSNTTLGSVVR